MEEEEQIQMFQLELKTFGKRNAPRFRLLDDLSLTIDTCKTPEVRTNLMEMTRRTIAEMAREEATLNKRIEKMLRDAAKGGDKKKDNKALEKRAKKIIDQFTSIHLGKNKRIKLKFKGLKKPPYVIFEWKF
jgi:hypothetical protein